MTSAIDASKPADGVPASKADLRNNLLVAKNEITALQAASLTLSPYALTGFRNRIINGTMDIDQRRTGGLFTVTPGTPGYSLDRWVSGSSAAGGTFTVQQLSASPPTASQHTRYARITVTVAKGSLLAGDFHYFSQPIEGIYIRDLLWGTVNAIPVVVSFWMRASISGTYSVALTNSGGSSMGYHHQVTIPVANTWTQVSFNVAGPTSGTWQDLTSAGIVLRFDLGTGSTYQGTPDVWSTGGTVCASSSNRLIQSGGATLDITGVQLEPGTIQSPFERRGYALELEQAQRYYENGQVNGAYYQAGAGQNTQWRKDFVTTKRVSASVILTNGSISNVTSAVATPDYTGFYIIVVNTAAGSFFYNATFTAESEL